MMYTVFSTMSLSTLLLASPAFHVTLDGAPPRNAPPISSGRHPFHCIGFPPGLQHGNRKSRRLQIYPGIFSARCRRLWAAWSGLHGRPGGFFLPPLFAYAEASTGLPQMTFAVLFAVAAASFLWLHITVLHIVRAAAPQVQNKFEIQSA